MLKSFDDVFLDAFSRKLTVSTYLSDELRFASHLLQYQRTDVCAFLVNRYLLANQNIILYSEYHVILKIA